MGRRATIIVLDGLGAGHAPDAADFGDEGANTLGNTAEAVGGLDAPKLAELGLGNVEKIEGVPPTDAPHASHGLMVEHSAAKATLAGHWEMMGLVLEDPLPTYPEGFPGRSHPALRGRDRARGHRATGPHPGRKSSRSLGRTRRRPAPGFSTPPPTRSSNSPPTRTSSRSKNSTKPAKKPTLCSSARAT